MRHYASLCSLAILLFATAFLHGGEETYVTVGSIRLWCESFGKKNDPALLLVMGGGSPGISWPDALCNSLAHAGFFVIRYDHRDMGLSSPIDYTKNPYDLMVLAQDAIAILDAFKIQKAHILGASMGGSIAVLLGAYFPHRVHTIMPMIATSDLSGILDPKSSITALPKPTKEYLEWVEETLNLLAKKSTKEERIALYLKGWKILNGNKTPFDTNLYENLVVRTMERMSHPQVFQNQFSAMKASLQVLQTALPLVQVPTIVLNGTEDPIFSKEHGEALARAIPRAQLILFEGMGHNFNPLFFSDLVTAICAHAKKTAA